MGNREEVAEKLRNMGQLRQELEALERALGELNPEERLVAEYMLISPERGNIRRLGQLLGVEQSSVYRRRERVLEKIAQALYRMDN